jgi:hypothetical protein
MIEKNSCGRVVIGGYMGVVKMFWGGYLNRFEDFLAQH